mmetsp:Transcript_22230/g.37140  ORF Transcript_22230/g.37140 Transcript_22230/m.37140 type:complete len:177 (+) Transcript_22230:282-812(+)|eukprot:CAMPEP_0198201930 /NCGR_PEP_ID=MMETSP1445-20131203/4960_1 /TAXON_ID=36898 /ORGANISM="Pyramimonas sp., Strain CCMP2087" /LENGTH=176 /DNA_ID=CAMNT_0043872593 /DNA_START=273 /DNA_END=803 /DNA_ORIENTATION=-
MEGLLDGLPSRGYFTSGNGNFLRVGAQRMPTYVCEHDTAPPEHQVITTDPTNILIRDLLHKKHKEERQKGKSESDSKGKSESDPKGKRPADGTISPEPKRLFTNASAVASGSGQRGTSSSKNSSFTEVELNEMTVDKLKALLRDKGQVTKGKKEELIHRVLQYQERRVKASRPLQT